MHAYIVQVASFPPSYTRTENKAWSETSHAVMYSRCKEGHYISVQAYVLYAHASEMMGERGKAREQGYI